MSREFSFIKPFRAIAAFWVLSGHVFQWWGASTPGHFPPPKLAVDLFMIISGYLMAANAFARDSHEPMSQSRNWLRFWLRRYFRVAPAYYLSLALVVLLSVPFLAGYQNLIHMAYGNALVGTDYDPAMVRYTPVNILMHLSFLFGLFPAYASSTYLPDWSLSLEMQFYLAFPFLFLFMRRFGFVVSAAVIGFTAFALGLLISRHIHYPEPAPLVMKLNCFVAGMVLYRFLAGGMGNMQGVATALLAIALVSVDYHRYHIYLLVLPALMSLMLLLGWLELHGKTPAWLTALIEGRIVQFASDTSYSVYLFHGFFIATVGLLIAGNEGFIADHPRLFNWLMYGFVVLGTYALSSVVYRFVELPGIQMGKHVITRLLPRSQGELSTSRSVTPAPVVGS